MKLHAGDLALSVGGEGRGEGDEFVEIVLWSGFVRLRPHPNPVPRGGEGNEPA